MVPEGSQLNPQQSATGPYPEPDKSIPYPHVTSWRPILILLSLYAWFFKVNFSP
jgi:hypothetical protein